MADERNVSTRGFVISIFVIAALLCCGVPIGGGYLYLKDSRDEPGIRAAGEAYLTAAVEGENTAAYDLLCESDRRKLSRATWKPVVERRAAPTGFRITDVTITRPSETPTQRVVTAQISYSGQPDTEVNLYVKKQDGAWKICGPPLL
ncbi:hypothetical protein I0C86_23900 [Plantactinospora sp. S1510]|uniref:DUF4878 domain-containing protein n=1 Tax=Plantactinospora alkalitolerans TaxID=2789879 RepID=A0ABS0H0N3_9ACTN|nr:hypothetical protein [Plantactinospora alkalitolerans]MBF9131985.1 hypothetical protein [Plantactinospora alkalitolerans]